MPEIHESVWVAPTAQLYGRIHVAEGASIWHNAGARAECQEIRIARMTNIQDFVMIHVGFDAPTSIGAFCTLAHHSVAHGCRIEDACLLGVGAVVMDGAVIGEGSIVAGGAVVPEGVVFPPHSVIAGVPAKRIAERDSSKANRINAWMYHRNAEAYRRGDHRAWEGPEFEAWQRALLLKVADDQDL